MPDTVIKEAVSGIKNSGLAIFQILPRFFAELPLYTEGIDS